MAGQAGQGWDFKVLSTNEQLESLKQPSNTASIEVLKSPTFWAVRSTNAQKSRGVPVPKGMH